MSVQIICGVEQVKKSPLEPYSELVCEFLDVFASELRKDEEAHNYPDIQTFAFWARKSNIQKKKQEFERRMQNFKCIGKGIVFHIAPSNVPINCMFTFAFGLLAGNANIVRIPTKQFPQVECMCRVLEQCLQKDAFHKIYEMTSIIRYGRDKEVTDWYSKNCNLRVIWGGDETIRDIRASELPPRSMEITFADRYSFGIVDAVKWKNADEKERKGIAEGFYNDTYLMDQNACSTPHLICWEKGNLTESEFEKIRDGFWQRVAEVAKKYELADIKVSEKYAMLCQQVMQDSTIDNVIHYDNLLYVCKLHSLPEDVITNCRGKYGLFYDYVLSDYQELCAFDNEKIQTCAYYGEKIDVLSQYILTHNFCGIDRIVPFGKTLDIDTVWDGYDLITQMSRIIAVNG